MVSYHLVTGVDRVHHLVKGVLQVGHEGGVGGRVLESLGQLVEGPVGDLQSGDGDGDGGLGLR